MRAKIYIGMAILFLLGMEVSVRAQNMGHSDNGWGTDPDSLATVTVSGTVLIDSSQAMPLYFLDVDGNGRADYLLHFGPVWYNPSEEPAVVRPRNGASVEITGGEHETLSGELPILIVYTLDGRQWRSPFESSWNHWQGQGGHNSWQERPCGSHFFGTVWDSVQTVHVSGIALIDSTFRHEQIYLDVTGDGRPNYFLNFGPPWFRSNSGAARPMAGDSLTIVGGLFPDSTLARILVYEVNGETWLDSSLAASRFGGHWMRRDMDRPQRIFAPFDTASWMQLNPGWGGSGQWHHGGMMMPDSVYGQLMQVYPQNLPNTAGHNAFAGFELVFQTTGNPGNTWQGNGCGGHMAFNSNFQMQLHYTDEQLRDSHLSEENIRLRYWDDEQNLWVATQTAVVDTQANTVSFSTSEIGGFIILTAESFSTGIEGNSTIVAGDFALRQNYPNPFNPETSIEFSLKNAAHAKITIYDVLGRVLATPFDGMAQAGMHRVQFRATALPSGSYFYRLEINNQTVQVRTMLLLK